MFKQPISIYSALKTALCGLLVIYGIAVTIALIKMKPRTILIGIDGRNTRVITQDTDALLESEKINFMMAFFETYYSFDSETYPVKAKEAKKMMSPGLWQKKKEELEHVEKKIHEENLKQNQELLSFDQIDKTSYLANLRIRIERRGTVTEFPLRVLLKLKKRIREDDIPYPIEVEVLDEKRMG